MSGPCLAGYFPFCHWAVKTAVRALRGLEVSGLENVPEAGPVIIAANHVSLLDPPLVGVAVYPRRAPFFVAKRELFRPAPVGAFIRGLGAIPVDRKAADTGAVRKALEVLEAAGCLVLFPEGTRARPGRPPRPPKAGVAYLARQTGAAVVPARVRGTDALLRRSPLSIRFGPPLAYRGAESREEYQRFAEAVMRAVFQL